MNSSQPSTGGGGMMTMIIVIVLLIAIGVGGYFGYTKWWVPKQCVGQAATSNVSTFKWDSDSSKCVANVCMTNYGCDANGTLCTTGDVCAPFNARVYKPVPANPSGGTTTTTGKCVATLITAETNKASDDPSCRTACDNSSTACVGYDWNTSTSLAAGVVACNLYSGSVPTAGDGNANTPNITCNALQPPPS